MYCNIDENKTNCNCTYEPCSRKGKCCECLTHHLKNEELPACVFPEDIEKTYVRSFKRFSSIVNGKD